MDYSIIPPSRTSKSHNWNPESAHSSVLGVLLLITIVMIMGGVVTLIFTSQPIPDKVPMAYLGIAKSSEGVELINKAGDTLTASSVTIIVDGIDRTAEFRSQENTPGWGTLKAGDRIHYTSSIKPESIQIVYAGNTGRYLLASSESTITTPIKVVTPQTTPAQPTQAVSELSVDALLLSATIPTSMSAGQSYPVSVTLKNTGQMTWTEASMIRLGGIGDDTGDAAEFGSSRIYIPEGTNVAAGAEYTFIFTMTAPAVPGTYTPQYKMVRDGHKWFGALASQTIQVGSTATVDAQLVSTTIPTTMNADQSYPVSVTMENTGQMTWDETSKIRLGGAGDGSGDAAKFGEIRIKIPAGTSVRHGEQFTFTFTMTAPSEGSYIPLYKMVWDGHKWFGTHSSQPVQVVGTATVDAQLVSTTIPTSMSPGQSYPVSVTMENTGSMTWNAGSMIHLGGVGDGSGVAAKFSPTRMCIPAGTSVPSGAQYTFTFTMTAPSPSGTYTPQYKMVWDGHKWFGAVASRPVQVVNEAGLPCAQFTSSTVDGQSPLMVQFTDQSIGTGPLTYHWDFSDGNGNLPENSQQNPGWRFWDDVATSYTVSLTVTNAYGSDTIVKQNYITLGTTTPSPAAPIAAFTSSIQSGTAPLTVQFTDKSVSTGTTSYQWDMNNDGVTDYTTKNPAHTYQSVGTYTVKLTVTNASGSVSEIKTNYITLSSLQSGECYGAEACNPTGNPIGGGTGYTRIITESDSRVKYVVSTKDQLISALRSAKSGEVVFVKGSAVIDMTGTPNTVIPAGVILASDRGNGASQGALIKYSSNNNGQYLTSLFIVGGNNVRVTGVRLEGEMLPQDGTGNGEASFMIAIKVQDKAGLEVDNCEIRGWAWSCVTTMDSTGTNIHHNYIHHNQARGEGYGADIYGGDMLVEANIFNYNRHDIASGGYPGERYEARYNLVRGDGHPIGSHHFDVHACNPNNLADDSETSSAFIAGDLYKIHHNTFEAGQQASIGVRSRPVTGAYINNNIFMSDSTDTSGGVPVWQRAVTWGNMFVTNNYWKGTIYTGDKIVWYLHP